MPGRGVGVVGVALMVGAVLTGCSSGPSTRPPLAMVDAELAPAGPGRTPSSTPTPGPPPDVQVPVTDLSWTDCTVRTRTRLALPAGPAGLVLECATLSVEVDPALSGELELGLLRARLDRTPSDAAPVVLVADADTPATTQLAGLAVGAWEPLLASRPVVALDRRGGGDSGPISCLTSDQRDAIVDLDPLGPVDLDPLGDAQDLGRELTLACTDVLTPAELAFDAGHAAADLAVLREAWGVESLAFVAVGAGAGVALRVAVQDPSSVSRLVLDSPTEPGADEVSLAQESVTGAEAAFDVFVSSCAAQTCPMGDPRATLTALLDRARSQNGLPGADGRRASAGAVLLAVRQALRSPATASAGVLGQALAMAEAGDATGLLSLVDAATGLATPGSDGNRLDSEFVARCSDAALRPTRDQVADLLTRWTTEHPIFGPDAAARLVLCLSWPTPPTTPELAELAALPPVLALGSAADPVAGPEATTRTVQALSAAGASARPLRWQGPGHPVLASSGCALSAVVGYLSSGALPESGTICPP